MANLSVKYAGLTLKSPVIISSSGITSNIQKIESLSDMNAGAIVLKSLFEEQINHESSSLMNNEDFPEAADYIFNYTRSNSLQSYLELIEASKSRTDIPILASINCVSGNEWIDYAKKIEDAGADALELNIFLLPNDKEKKAKYYEENYLDIVTKVIEKVKIPVTVKLGMYFTNMLHIIDELYKRGVKGVVLFNRFYSPDIDIHKMEITSSEVFSTENDIRHSLRWIGLASSVNKEIDLSASTGVHNGEGVIKQLLAGASAVQVCSTLYKNGIDIVEEIVNDVEKWMDDKGFKSITEFKGKLNYGNIPNPEMYERAQFMKYFASID
ncbi:dihydroorotate dehydrogenase-like protein [Bacteroidales bacterium]|nr:dihydroorotate dehydrogenase-like protein [Bacteroidales bacterium]